MVDPEAVRRPQEELAELGPVRRDIDETSMSALGELGLDDEVQRAIVYDRHIEEVLAESDENVKRPRS